MSITSSYSCVVLCVWAALHALHASAFDLCDSECEDGPVFSPSSLVLRYGERLAATCTVCRHRCLGAHFDVEKAVGQSHRNGSAPVLLWTVPAVTEWGTSALCYYNDVAHEDHQCCTRLRVTVYQPPSRVSIGLLHHEGPLLEGRRYTLQCVVQDAAPANSLRVAFYKGRSRLANKSSESSPELREPHNENFTLDFQPSRKDDGASFWCEASLELDLPGPQPRVASTGLTALVHYRPEVAPPPAGTVVSIRAGDSLRLGCQALGNPAPVYWWRPPSRPPGSSHGAELVVPSATWADGGLYTCTASNSMGNVTLTFQVEVRANYTPYAVGAACVLLLLISSVLLIVYRRNHTGTYDLVAASRGSRI